MDAHGGLLIPAAQKLYGALVNLEKFSRHNDFLDNIASLDNLMHLYDLPSTAKSKRYLRKLRKIKILYLYSSYMNAGLIPISQRGKS